MHALLRDVPPDEYRQVQMHHMEFIHQRMDAATRATGTIVKYVRVIDACGLSSRNISLRFVLRDAEDNHELDSLYPQLLDSVLYVNAPRVRPSPDARSESSEGRAQKQAWGGDGRGRGDACGRGREGEGGRVPEGCACRHPEWPKEGRCLAG